VDAEDFEVPAAVSAATFAGGALPAVDVGFDGAAVAGLDVGDALADFEDFDAELVTGDAGVAVEGHFAQIAGDVGAAYPDAVDADEGFAGGRERGFFEVDGLEVEGFLELDGLHGGGELSVVSGQL
jgi:hypothetical protein